jgi:hypothetical protein
MKSEISLSCILLLSRLMEETREMMMLFRMTFPLLREKYTVYKKHITILSSFMLRSQMIYELTF